MPYKFELGHDITEATKNTSCEDEGIVYHNTVTRGFKKFCLGCKNLNNQAMSGRIRTVNTEAIALQAIEVNLT